MENERMALKLRDRETYYEIWKGDKDYKKHKEEALAEWRKNRSEKEKKEIKREASKLILRSEIQQLAIEPRNKNKNYKLKETN